MKRLFAILSIVIAFAATVAAADPFPLKAPGIDSTNTAVVVYDLRFNRPIVSYNPDRPLIPASIMKALTAASVLNLADSDERFFTSVVAEGVIADGRLKGNVVVKATGDPTIESEHLDESRHFADSVAMALKNMGITAIEGDVIIDESDFIHTGTPPGWMKEDLTWPYGTDLHGANFRDNKFTLRMPSKTTVPHVPDLQIRHINPRAKARSLKRQDGSSTVTVSGRIPSRGWSDKLSTPNPSAVMRHELIERIKAEEITVSESKSDNKGDITLLYTHISPSFGQILRSLMFRSDNLMAEGMLRSLKPGDTREKAIAEELTIWKDRGLNTSGINIEDGSGLSRNDRLTAGFMVSVLREMLSMEFGSDYTSLFPRAGYDGTMRNAFLDTELEGRAAFKTGSMKGVRSFAGYYFDEFGHPTHIIVLISNNLRCSGAKLRKAFEEFLLEQLN